MKNFFWVVLVLAYIACGDGQPSQNSTTDTTVTNSAANSSLSIDSTPVVQRHTGLNDFKEYKLTDTILADFNGDKNPDKAFINIAANTKQLYILDGRSQQSFLIGRDASFDGVADNLDWVDFWGLTMDSVSSENIMRDGEPIGTRDLKLNNPSIVLMREEVGGGLVSFRKGKYVWIHQAD